MMHTAHHRIPAEVHTDNPVQVLRPADTPLRQAAAVTDPPAAARSRHSRAATTGVQADTAAEDIAEVDIAEVTEAVTAVMAEAATEASEAVADSAATVVAEVTEDTVKTGRCPEQKFEKIKTLNMKKIFTLIAAVAATFSAYAQGPADALRYSQLSLEGSARTIAMGNAFTALGGDIGAISVNPAGSAVMRHSEVSLSPSVIFCNDGADCLGTSVTDRGSQFVISNGGISLAFDTNRMYGVRNFNFGIAINRVADFNSVSGFACTTGQSSMLGAMASDLAGTSPETLATTEWYNPFFDSDVPWNDLLAYDCWLLSLREGSFDPDYDWLGSTENDDAVRYIPGRLHQNFYNRTRGGIMQYAVNFGFNINDKLYLGFNINMQSLRYTVDETYSEEAENPDVFDDGFKRLTSSYWQETTGVGVNGKFGVIYTPIGGLRLGATFTTPTAYRLNDTWNRSMSSDFIPGSSEKPNHNRWTSPDGYCKYRLVTPLQWSLGIAYTFSNVGLISVDYENVNYAAASLQNANANASEFWSENKRINRGFKASSIIRAGAEFKPLEALSLRLGYNYQSGTGDLVDYEGYSTFTYPARHYVSGGAGIRFGRDLCCSFDAAYQQMLRVSENYTMYPDYEADSNWFTAPEANGWHSTGKLVFTFTFRF